MWIKQWAVVSTSRFMRFFGCNVCHIIMDLPYLPHNFPNLPFFTKTVVASANG